MKKYFTKFLPVEGEPKRGDIVMDTEGICVYWGDRSIFGLQYRSEKMISYINKPRRAQLMLCSTELSDGDKAWTIIGNCYDNFRSWYEKEFWIKVIAPISKGAKWLKEGQELTESQIVNIYGIDVKISNPARLQVETARFDYFPTDDDVESWSDIYLASHGGRGVEWNLKDVKLDHIKVLCSNCDTFH
jgi:hypothetical protein